MSKPLPNPQHARVQKVCTLWTHDDNFSREDIVFNHEKFPELPTDPGSLLQIVAIHTDDTVREFHTGPKNTQHDVKTRVESVTKSSNVDDRQKRIHRGSITMTIDENGSTIPGGRDIDSEKAYVFVPRALPADLKSKYANLQVSYNQSLLLQSRSTTRVWSICGPQMQLEARACFQYIIQGLNAGAIVWFMWRCLLQH
jgi:hypothetical protein